MIRRIVPALLVLLALIVAPAMAQEPAAPTQAARGSVHALADDGPPPATRRAYTHLFAAYAFAGLLIGGYAVSLGRRGRRIRAEMEALG